MSIHIEAKPGEIAETVLISGDPLRAKFVADNFLVNAVCYSGVRNMLGYTGYFKNERVSVQGTGMGQPSLAIYVHELIHEYGVKNIIRIGTCGALDESIKLGALILAQGASTDSTINRKTFAGLDFAPTADFDLLLKAYEQSKAMDVEVVVGDIFSTDLFYGENDPARWKVWQDHKVLCVEMESAALYTMAARAGVKALSILTVSDNIITGASSSPVERERGLDEMARLALSII